MLASDRNFSRDILGYLITVSEKSVKDDDSVNFRKSPMMPLFTNRCREMSTSIIVIFIFLS